eukprot:scaffold26782_cov78-Skeletonema_dohrnii-CCMP3373.AAC.1
MADDEGAFTEGDMYSPTRDANISTLAMAMLFGSIIFATASLAARLWLAGMWNWDSGGAPIHVTLLSSSSASEETVALVSQNDYTKDSSSKDLKKSKEPLDTTSLPSIYNLLHHCT